MENKETHILIIDDSVEDIRVTMESLKDDYAVSFRTTGEGGLELAEKDPKPDIILLDVMMPGMGGYTTCEQLKKNASTKDIDVIFVSAHDTTEEILAGYDAGGSDYLIKPVQPSELLTKINLAVQNRKERLKIKSEKDIAFSTAMTAMSSAGEQGSVIEFLRNCFKIDTTEKLAQLIVSTIEKFDTSCTVQIRTKRGNINASSSEPVPPLEKELLERLKDSDRIMSVGRRTIFNNGIFSLLIKSMPIDEDKSGRYRDHLAILMEGAESKYESIKLKEDLYTFLEKSNTILQGLQTDTQVHKEVSQKMMDEMLQNLVLSFTPWDLSDEQETLLMSLVEREINKSLDHFESGLSLDTQLKALIEELTQSVG